MTSDSLRRQLPIAIPIPIARSGGNMNSVHKPMDSMIWFFAIGIAIGIGIGSCDAIIFYKFFNY